MKTAISKNGDHQRGVTLTELLIVLTIMALMATLSIVALRGPSDQMLLDQTADRIVADLRRVAAVSRQRGEAGRIVFDRETYQADLLEGEPVVLPQNIHLELEEPVTLEFYPDGYSPGGEISLRLEDREVKILVHPFSGRVRIVS